MNIELNNATENEIEYVEDEIDYTPKKFVKFRVLIILCCAVFSFFVWCYAHYLNDPILIDKMEIKWAWVENIEDANQIITDINGNVIKDMKVVFTDTESKTASTAVLLSARRSSRGIPSLSNVFISSGSISLFSLLFFFFSGSA